MANIFDILNGRNAFQDAFAMPDTVKLMHHNDILEEDTRYLEQRVVDLEEDLLRISDAFDRQGTYELTGMNEGEAAEIPLMTVKRISRTARATMAMNPFVKRGVEARIGYIWGKGVNFDDVDGIESLLKDNRKRLFSPQALTERERVLATDGNMFIAHATQQNYAKNDATSFRISIEEITGSISNPDDKEEIWYYKRQWTTRALNANTNRHNTTPNTRWYISMSYAQKLEKQGKTPLTKWGKDPVDQNFVMQHISVNKQVGWRWGIPDIMPVIFWAKAYKEYLEDNATLVKAYSRLAWQVKVPSGAAGPGIAAQLLQSSRFGTGIAAGSRDDEIGSSMVAGGGVEMAPLATNASSIDFSKGAPLASAIAAGLEISQTVLTSSTAATGGSYSAEQSLDLPTLKAMEMRQQLHEETFLELFDYWGAEGAEVTWPSIYTDAPKDIITSLGTSIELGLVYPEEGRREALEALKIQPVAQFDELPDPADNPLNQYKEEQATKAFQNQQQLSNQVAQAQNTVQNGQVITKVAGATGAPPAAPPTGGGSVVAKQGVSGGVSAKGKAQSTANSARTNRANSQKKS